ncbi:MAG TPA: hypothetical protein DCZ07_04485 [Alphaproteobacteria bacterium]|nr:hypothetical protein [Alphaproteobacteria bacterium]
MDGVLHDDLLHPELFRGAGTRGADRAFQRADQQLTEAPHHRVAGSARILLIGHVTRDIIRVPGRRDREQPGGSVYYAGMALCGLGHQVTILTRIASRDEALLLADLRRAGARVENLPSARTACFVNAQGPGGIDDRVQEMRAEADPFGAALLQAVQGLSCDAVYFGSLLAGDLDAALILRIAECFPRAIKLFDAQGPLRVRHDTHVMPCVWPDGRQVLSVCDIVKADQEESLRLTGARTAAAAAARLADLGVAQVLITRGGQGALLRSGGRSRRLAAWRPRSGVCAIVDTTGCGDTFLAAYLHAVLSGRPPQAAAQFAAIAATMKLTRFGPLCCGENDIVAFAAQP